ncbi:MAG: hypothetical protein ACK4OM_06205 [Alphaproteobacteria bacterium]
MNIFETRASSIIKTEDFRNGILNLNKEIEFKTPEDVKLFFVKLNSNEQKLVELHVGLKFYSFIAKNSNFSTLQHDPVKKEIIISLLNLITSNKNLRIINFKDNKLNYSETQEFVSKLKEHNFLNSLSFKYLKEINFSGNNFNDESISSIAKIIQKSKSLYKFDISNCNLNNDQLRKLMDALKDNQSIQKVNLKQNLSHISISEPVLSLVKNHMFITSILFDNNDLSDSNIKEIKEALNHNITLQNHRFKRLLFPEFRYGYAIKAIENDDAKWLEVILGPDEKQTLLYNSVNQELKSKEREAFEISNNIEVLNILHNYFTKIRDNSNNNNNNNIDIDKLKQILNKLKKDRISIVDEKLDRSSLEVDHNGQLVPMTLELKMSNIQSEASSLDNIIEKYLGHVIMSNNFKDLLNMTQTKLTEYQEMEQRLITEKHSKSWQDKILIIQNYTQIMDKLSKIFQKKASKYFSAFDLIEIEQVQKELIQGALPINTLQKGVSLLQKAYYESKTNCVRLLIAKGGDVVTKDISKGVSVLSLAIKGQEKYFDQKADKKYSLTISSECRNIILEHIKKNIKLIWPNDIQEHLPEETGKLNAMKSIVTDYIDTLIQCQKSSTIWQFFTGRLFVKNYRADESVQYLEYLRKASTHESLIVFLNKISELAFYAKEGLIDTENLHGKMSEIVDPFLDSLTKDPKAAEDYNNRLIKAYKKATEAKEQKAMQNDLKQYKDRTEKLEKQDDERKEEIKRLNSLCTDFEKRLDRMDKERKSESLRSSFENGHSANKIPLTNIKSWRKSLEIPRFNNTGQSK